VLVRLKNDASEGCEYAEDDVDAVEGWRFEYCVEQSTV
jgi:hypothetical protein